MRKLEATAHFQMLVEAIAQDQGVRHADSATHGARVGQGNDAGGACRTYNDA